MEEKPMNATVDYFRVTEAGTLELGQTLDLALLFARMPLEAKKELLAALLQSEEGAELERLVEEAVR
jgi:hypothetical protein